MKLISNLRVYTYMQYYGRRAHKAAPAACSPERNIFQSNRQHYTLQYIV